MLYFVLGLIAGIVATCIGVSRLIIGRLRHVTTEEGTYFFMELSDPDISKIIKRKYIVLEVARDISHK